MSRFNYNTYLLALNDTDTEVTIPNLDDTITRIVINRSEYGENICNILQNDKFADIWVLHENWGGKPGADKSTLTNLNTGRSKDGKAFDLITNAGMSRHIQKSTIVCDSESMFDIVKAYFRWYPDVNIVLNKYSKSPEYYNVRHHRCIHIGSESPRHVKTTVRKQSVTDIYSEEYDYTEDGIYHLLSKLKEQVLLWEDSPGEIVENTTEE